MDKEEMKITKGVVILIAVVLFFVTLWYSITRGQQASFGAGLGVAFALAVMIAKELDDTIKRSSGEDDVVSEEDEQPEETIDGEEEEEEFEKHRVEE